MRRWLRPGGVASFAAVVVLLVLGWTLLADLLVKRAVEGIGTRLVGARVELGAADVGLFPPALAFTDLAVTDPDAPMTNAFQVKRIGAALDGGALLGARLVIDTLRVEGVRLHTPRTRSGALARKAAREPARSGPSLPAFELPDVSAILRDNPLTAVSDAEQLARDVRAARVAWEERIAALPDRERLEGYRERLQALRDVKGGGLGGLLGAAGEVRDLKADIDRDVAAVRDARDTLATDLKEYRRRAGEVAAAPAREAKRLADRYAGEGVAGVGAAFLTDAAERWFRAGLEWYRRLEPLVARAARPAGEARVVRPLRAGGVDVRFPERAPRPDLLVREAVVQVALTGGEVAGTVRDLTPDPVVLGRPLTFAFSGERSAVWGGVSAEGTIDRVDPARPRDRFHLRLAGVPVKDVPLSRGGAAPVTLAEARADLTVDGRRTGDDLDVTANAGLAGARLVLAGGEGRAAEALAQALAGVRKADVEASLTGTVDAPRVRVRSDLDAVVAGALRAVMRERVQALEADLTAVIRERVADRLGEAQGEMTALDGVADLLGQRHADLDGVLAEALKGTGRKLPF